MIAAILVLLLCEIAGDLLRQMLALAVPGPVIGMSILAVVLAWREEGPPPKWCVTDTLKRTAEGLIRHMGLLFVPAGVGLIAEIDVLRREWLPIAASLVGSTLLSLVVTGLVMHWSIRRRCPAVTQTVKSLERG